MPNKYEKSDIDIETINDWFEAIEIAECHNKFTYSVEYQWKTKKSLTEKQVRGLRSFAWSAYKTLCDEESWNFKWDSF